MVRGLDTFKNYFKDYKEHYIVIGGTAMATTLEEAGFTPRATKDIDIIFVIEALNAEFGKVFWQFILDGEYNTREIDEVRTCYRFTNPVNEDYPKQIELFSRVPDGIVLPEDAHLTPIPLDEGLSSLSAILLDEGFYQFTITNCSVIDEVNYANHASMICLKAYAYLSNKAMKAEGKSIKQVNIDKHKNDIFRIANLLSDQTIEVPDDIIIYLQQFIDDVKDQLPSAPTFDNNFGKGTDALALLNQLAKVFKLRI